MSSLASIITEMQKENKVLKKSNHTLSEEKKTIQDRNSNLQSDYTESESAIGKIRRECEGLKMKIEELEKSQDDFGELELSLKGQLEASKQEVRNLKSECLQTETEMKTVKNNWI